MLQSEESSNELHLIEQHRERLIWEDEDVSKLISQGIAAVDVKRLQDAEIFTCSLILQRKKDLTGIEGLFEAKIDKICKAAEGLVNSGYTFGRDELWIKVHDELETTEEDRNEVIKMMMRSILNAMIYPVVDLKSTTLNLLNLVLHLDPPFVPELAQKVIQMYTGFINDYTLHDKKNVDIALKGLTKFLAIMPWLTKDTDDGYNGILLCYSNITHDMKYLGRALAYRFQSFISIHTESLDWDTFQYLASVLKCIRLVVISFSKSNSSSLVGLNMVVWDADVSQYFTMLFDCFPLRPFNGTLEKVENDMILDLNLIIALVFFELHQWIGLHDFVDRFVYFTIAVLNGKLCTAAHSKQSVWEVHLTELIAFVPALILSREDSTNNDGLLRAFTHTFTESELDSYLKSICLLAVKDLLGHMFKSFMCSKISPQLKSEYIYDLLAWMKEVPPLLLQLGNKLPSHLLVGVQVLRGLGKWTGKDISLLRKYDSMQNSLSYFFCNWDGGVPMSGPFLSLSDDSKGMVLCCLMYFTRLEVTLLRSLLWCCLCPTMSIDILFRIINLVNSFEVPIGVTVTDYVFFSIKLVSGFRVFSEATTTDAAMLESRTLLLKEMTNCFCSYLKERRKYFEEQFHSIENDVVHEILQHSVSINCLSLLKILGTIDAEETRLTEQSMLSLGHFIFKYLESLKLSKYRNYAEDLLQASEMWAMAKDHILKQY